MTIKFVQSAGRLPKALHRPMRAPPAKHSKRPGMLSTNEQADDAMTTEEMAGTAKPPTPSTKRHKDACTIRSIQFLGSHVDLALGQFQS